METDEDLRFRNQERSFGQVAVAGEEIESLCGGKSGEFVFQV